MSLKIMLPIALIFLYSCSSSEQQDTKKPLKLVDPFESALPHGAEIPGASLSDSDKLKLAQAHGKMADVIAFQTLDRLINNDTSGLTLYHFWTLDCQHCISMIDHLKDLQYNVFHPETLKVVYINVDGLYPEMVNSLIREKGIVDAVYTIQVDTITNWTSSIQPSWNGQLPANLIVNNVDGTRLFYQKEFTKQELQTVLLPLTIF